MQADDQNAQSQNKNCQAWESNLGVCLDEVIVNFREFRILGNSNASIEFLSISSLNFFCLDRVIKFFIFKLFGIFI
jgi:hypothetical protein